MKDQSRQAVRCAAGGKRDQQTGEPSRALFAGAALNQRFRDAIFQNFTSTKLYLLTVIHTVGKRSGNTGKFVAVVDDAWISSMVKTANDIWAQACIEMVPYNPGMLMTTFEDLSISAFAGECLTQAERNKIAPYAVSIPQTKIINVYLVDDTTGDACGSPFRGEIFMPTAGHSPEQMEKICAHELGHLLLNPVGIDDSTNPDHLMFHHDQHPNLPQGKNTGLFLSDCIGARATAAEDYFAYNRPGGFNFGSDSEPLRCRLNPQLGFNLEIVMTEEVY